MPGEGGFEPTTGVHWPLAGKFAGYAGLHDGERLNWVAPPAMRSASVALPACAFLTRGLFAGSICQTLASYLSTQIVPTSTESFGHFFASARGASASMARPKTQMPHRVMSPSFFSRLLRILGSFLAWSDRIAVLEAVQVVGQQARGVSH